MSDYDLFADQILEKVQEDKVKAEMVALKPCPFCGGEAEMKTSKHIPSGTDYTPRCKNTSCCGRLTKKYTVEETAVYMWNRRADDGKSD